MWGFWKRRKEQSHSTAKREAEQEDQGFRYEREYHRPVIRASICTGEQVAGFKDRRTGRFTEIMLVRNNEDLEEFTRKYDISRQDITREW